ncbi:MAG: class I SAM-dependent methyltransferase [Dehalococcoidia bacterium]|nr:class I SAM-dependent methyltransferase [Dehalococcoidia bacterium]
MSGIETSRYSILEPGNLLIIQERERALMRLLRQIGIDSLEGRRAFEAGCAGGYNLRMLVQWGMNPADVVGQDLDASAAAAITARSPGIQVHTGSCEQVAEPDQSFDLGLAFTLFSSVPDEDVAHGIARELFRVVRPGGLILVYDMRRRSPRNPNVHPIGTEDLRRWFPRCPLRAQSITLAPPVARLVGRHAPWAYGPLAAVPLARTHMLWTLRRPALPPSI